MGHDFGLKIGIMEIECTDFSTDDFMHQEDVLYLSAPLIVGAREFKQFYCQDVPNLRRKFFPLIRGLVLLRSATLESENPWRGTSTCNVLDLVLQPYLEL